MNKNFIFLDIKKKEKHLLKMNDTGEHYQASEHDLINKGEEIAISYQQTMYNVDITKTDPEADLQKYYGFLKNYYSYSIFTDEKEVDILLQIENMILNTQKEVLKLAVSDPHLYLKIQSKLSRLTEQLNEARFNLLTNQ